MASVATIGTYYYYYYYYYLIGAYYYYYYATMLLLLLLRCCSYATMLLLLGLPPFGYATMPNYAYPLPTHHYLLHTHCRSLPTAAPYPLPLHTHSLPTPCLLPAHWPWCLSPDAEVGVALLDILVQGRRAARTRELIWRVQRPDAISPTVIV